MTTTTYQQRAVAITMDNGSTTTWIGWAEDSNHAEGLAIEWALEMFGDKFQVFDTMVMPHSYFDPALPNT